jgi:hypothetical protein
MHDLIEKMKTNMTTTSTSNSYQTYTPTQLQGQNISTLISFGQNRTSSSTLNQHSSNPIKQTFIVPSNQTLSRISANLTHGNNNPIYYDQSNNNTTRQINNCINNYNSYLTNSTSI